jgi:hypothetical protein
VAEDDDQAALQAKVKVSKETAQQSAQTQVRDGTVKESELEMEKGKLIWSFGFTIPDSKDIKEVNIDAVTGVTNDHRRQRETNYSGSSASAGCGPDKWRLRRFPETFSARRCGETRGAANFCGYPIHAMG